MLNTGPLVATGLILVALAGCASKPAQQAVPESVYLDLVHGYGTFEPVTDEHVVALGHNVCDVMDEIDPPDNYVQVLNVFLDQGFDAGDVGAFITLSVNQYCPEHIEDVPGVG